MATVHPTAIVHPQAQLAAGVSIGPYAVVDAGVSIGPDCVLYAHAVVRGSTVLGARNAIHPFAVIGGDPQARRHAGGEAPVEVGDDNVFREHVTVHGGTDGGATRIGAANLFMVGSHVAHDSVIGSHCVLANCVQLAGHARVEDWVTFGGLSGVAQHVRVGENAFVAAAAACERDVPPFVIVQGDRARVRGLNAIGLRRRGIPEASIAALARAVRALWRGHLTHAEAVRRVAESDDGNDPCVTKLLDALAEARARGGARR
jgi:UDP-N-acetylglucosamine acyltransferase